MRKNVRIIPVDKLIGHERVSLRKCERILKDLKNNGIIHQPVVVDKKTLVILDGHHRVAVLKKIGIKKVPVILVNYHSKNIQVYLRRKNILMDLIKYTVINKALSSDLLPKKTTRHVINYRPKKINIKLNRLF